MADGPERGDGWENPHQQLFYRLGFVSFAGSVVTGLMAATGSADMAYGPLCLALGIMTVGFFGLFTWIHLRH